MMPGIRGALDAISFIFSDICSDETCYLYGPTVGDCE